MTRNSRVNRSLWALIKPVSGNLPLKWSRPNPSLILVARHEIT